MQRLYNNIHPPDRNLRYTGAMPQPRHYTLIDRLILQFANSVETVCGDYVEHRPNPAANTPASPLTSTEAKHSAGLMRVNHTGEVCAQGLYLGQLSVARNSETQALLKKSCEEETDHLAWCDTRLQALNSHRSYLNGFFYWNSFALGVISGLCGDDFSLGFVEETEKQVGAHLESHLEKLSPHDTQSRKIIEQMAIDEAEHGAAAKAAGGKELPPLVRTIMTLQSKVMTALTYWI